MIKRRITRQVRISGVRVGGNASIPIQSMAKVGTSSTRACISQIKRLEAAGCEIVRVAVKNLKDAEAIKDIKRGIQIPLVADIHFDYRLALASIKSGADKIRLNPWNMRKRSEIEEVARAARKARIPIRIGLNSGSISTDMVKAALDYIKLFEEIDFRDIIVSLKASDVATTVKAYREISKRCDYPLHLGVTAAGPYDSGVVKSAIGIGALLLDGIGDTVRVSLTADPVEEVIAAKRILSALNLRRFGPEIISCPTCGRCQVDLAKIVDEVSRKVAMLQCHKDRKIRIAIMGCEVNGPGEAKESDIGIAFGKGSGVLFKNGKIIKKITVDKAVNELIKLLSKN